jgi:type VI secretion system protein
MKRAPLFIAILLCMLSLGACSFISYAMDYKSTTDLKQIKVVALHDANLKMSTAIDVVFVFDKNILAVLPKTGPDWFGGRSGGVAD